MQLYINKLKCNLGNEFLIEDNPVSVYIKDSKGAINQEIYLKLITSEKSHSIIKVSRGNEAKVAEFEKIESAYFYLSVLGKNLKRFELFPTPSKISDLFEYEENSSEHISSLISSQIQDIYFEIFETKSNAICLIKENQAYSVYYVDNNLNKHEISGNRKLFGVTVQVLANYAWLLQWIENEAKEWNSTEIEMDKVKLFWLTGI